MPDEINFIANNSTVRQETLVLRMRGADALCKIGSALGDLCMQIYTDLKTMVDNLITSNKVVGRERVYLRESLLTMM